MINGVTAQQQQVQNLFHSVQLNVNNPHFLIMQGRITKVLNMKPPEILSMIEEAAGTRMFETKKQAALKTIVSFITIVITIIFFYIMSLLSCAYFMYYFHIAFDYMIYISDIYFSVYFLIGKETNEG